MKTTKSFPFNKARRITGVEVKSARKAIEARTGKKRRVRGRPAVAKELKYIPVSIRLDPRIVRWAKKESKRRRTGYQTIINATLLRRIPR